MPFAKSAPSLSLALATVGWKTAKEDFHTIMLQPPTTGWQNCIDITNPDHCCHINILEISTNPQLKARNEGYVFLFRDEADQFGLGYAYIPDHECRLCWYTNL